MSTAEYLALSGERPTRQQRQPATKPKPRKRTDEAPLSVEAIWRIVDVKEALAWEVYVATVKAAWTEAEQAVREG
jgi:hypothetical protein